MQLEEDYFTELIEKKTGLKMGKEWGVIDSPLGFKVWKSKDGFEKEGLFTNQGVEQNIENVINFLKTP